MRFRRCRTCKNWSRPAASEECVERSEARRRGRLDMLKRLELIGFKSFADKTAFDFAAGVTGVIGPNGSGKSNVVDAVRWVLGEQSAKSLRGGEMTDVIFNGSASRKSLGLAEVSMTFDNRRRSLASDADEVHITRRVYRSGEGEYLINGQPCRLKDIKDLFLGSGAGTDAYCIIEQGQVDVLLQTAPTERRMIFEEAAGISRFRAKKTETQRRLGTPKATSSGSATSSTRSRSSYAPCACRRPRRSATRSMRRGYAICASV